MAINRFSENYLLWANRVLFNSVNKVTIHTYIYQSWICAVFLFPSGLPSSSCVKPVVAFHCHLCPLAVLFVRRIPGSQALPLLLSFHQHHVVLGSRFSLGYPVSFGSISTRCPRGFWDTCQVCPQPGLSTMITRWTRLNRLPKIVFSIN